MADTIVMPGVARVLALEAKVAGMLDGMDLFLFKNNYTPVVGSVLGSFTVADFPGYANQTITDWSAVYLNGSNNAESDTGVHTFTCTGAPAGGSQDIYGWGTTDGTNLGPCARFSAPVPITLTGANQSLSIQILFEDGPLGP